jgi:hypothetical protein
MDHSNWSEGDVDRLVENRFGNGDNDHHRNSTMTIFRAFPARPQTHCWPWKV